MKRNLILAKFTIADLDNPITLLSIQEALMNADIEDNQIAYA